MAPTAVLERTELSPEQLHGLVKLITDWKWAGNELLTGSFGPIDMLIGNYANRVSVFMEANINGRAIGSGRYHIYRESQNELYKAVRQTYDRAERKASQSQ